MKDLNQCNFIGRLGQDVDMKYTATGSAVANLSIACQDDYKDKAGAKIEQTNWVRVVMFGKLAEITGQYAHKGSKIYVSGKQVTRTWDNKEGVKQYTTEIVANEMQLLDSKSEGGQQQRQPAQANPKPAQSGGSGGDGFDDIPF
jgi:single-strand DNA-binding protein